MQYNFKNFLYHGVWRDATWQVLTKHNVGNGLVKAIESLYNNNSNAVMKNNESLEWLPINDGVWQGCILSPCLFNVFLEKIMTEAPEGFEGSVKTPQQPLKSRNVWKLQRRDWRNWTSYVSLEIYISSVKVQLLKMLIKSIALHDAETCTYNNKIEKKIHLLVCLMLPLKKAKKIICLLLWDML